MKSDEFEKFRTELNRSCEEILLKKGADYSGPTDRHRNFREAAEAFGLFPLQVWGIFFKKHLDSIFTYVRDGKVQSEPILERMKDARNYLDLGAALIYETEQAIAEAGGISPWMIQQSRKEIAAGNVVSHKDAWDMIEAAGCDNTEPL